MNICSRCYMPTDDGNAFGDLVLSLFELIYFLMLKCESLHNLSCFRTLNFVHPWYMYSYFPLSGDAKTVLNYFRLIYKLSMNIIKRASCCM